MVGNTQGGDRYQRSSNGPQRQTHHCLGPWVLGATVTTELYPSGFGIRGMGERNRRHLLLAHFAVF